MSSSPKGCAPYHSSRLASKIICKHGGISHFFTTNTDTSGWSKLSASSHDHEDTSAARARVCNKVAQYTSHCEMPPKLISLHWHDPAEWHMLAGGTVPH